MSGRFAALIVLLVVVSGCSSSSGAAYHSPVASGSRSQSPSSPSPTGTPPLRSLLVMVGTSGDRQTISLVDRDGHLVASTTSAIANVEGVPFPGTPFATASTGPAGPYGIGGVCCGAGLPEVNTSNRRAYFLAGQNDLRYLGVDGSSGHVAQLPNVAGRSQAVFAISPDDTRIAVSEFDWSQKPMKVTIYVEDLAGGHRVVIFISTSLYEWPVAWHAGSLVLAVCCILGGAPNPYAAVDYHVVDPNTGRRLAELGSTACQAIGPLVAAGTLCNSVCNGGDVHNPPPGAQVCLNAVDWSGMQKVLYRYQDPNGIGTWAALAPQGGAVVLEENGPPSGQFVIRADGSRVNLSSAPSTPVVWWLDSDTLWLAGPLYRISSGHSIPLPESLGFVQGVVPSLS
jgi:hypothetical protein